MFLSLLPPALLVKYHTKYFLSAFILKLRKNVQHRRTYLWFIRLMRRWTKQIRTGKEIRFRFWLSEDKAGKEAKRRPTGW